MLNRPPPRRGEEREGDEERESKDADQPHHDRRNRAGEEGYFGGERRLPLAPPQATADPIEEFGGRDVDALKLLALDELLASPVVEYLSSVSSGRWRNQRIYYVAVTPTSTLQAVDSLTLVILSTVLTFLQEPAAFGVAVPMNHISPLRA